MDRFNVISLVGEGSFGRVYKAIEISNKSIVALKIISKKGRSSKELKGFRREREIQCTLRHPNIIQMLDSFETNNEIVVVTEYAKCDLHSLLAREGSIGEPRAQKLTYHLVSALYYLHSHRILHRDLKPQNILLDKDEHAKLCDFGLARNMTIGTHVLTSIKGTPLYMAPELMAEKPYDHQADLWSLGCILYEVLAGEPPFSTTSILHLVRLIRHEDVKWPSFLTDECISFLQGLLEKDPVQRMCWNVILNHTFVKGNITILNENIPESPFTNPLTASQSREKERQSENIIQGTIIKNKKKETNFTENMQQKTLAEDLLSSSRDSMHAILQSDIDGIDTDFDEGTDSSKKNFNIKACANILDEFGNLAIKLNEGNVCFVTGNSNMIVNHFNDNFPNSDNGNENDNEKNKSDKVKKIKNNELEKRKLSQNLDNFSLRLGGGSLDIEKQTVNGSKKDNTDNKQKRDKDVNKKSTSDTLTKKVTNSPPTVLPGWDSCDDSQHAPIENEEWLAFLYRSMQEILDGEMDSLKQQNLVSIIVAPLRNTRASCNVVESVVQLLSLPLILGGPPTIIADIRSVYVEVKLVPNLIYASKLLCGKKLDDEANTPSPILSNATFCRTISGLGNDEKKTLSLIYELVSHLIHLGDNFLTQFCDAVAILGADELLINFLSCDSDDKSIIQLTNSVLSLLSCAIRELPENAELIEKIIFDKRINLILLMKHNDSLQRTRICMLLRLLGRFSCYALQNNWTKEIRETLEALVYDSNEEVRIEAEGALEEFKHLSFYVQTV